MSVNDYVGVVNNTDERPFTSYPLKLTKYLFKRYGMKENSKILDKEIMLLSSSRKPK